MSHQKATCTTAYAGAAATAAVVVLVVADGEAGSALGADGAGLAGLWIPFVSARSGTAEVRVGSEETAYCGDTVTPAGQNGSPGGSRVLGISGMTTYSIGVTAGTAGAAADAPAATAAAPAAVEPVTVVVLGLAGEGIDGGEIIAGSAEAECGWDGVAAAAAPAVAAAPADAP